MISLNFTLLLKFLIKIILFLYENEHSLSEYVYNHISYFHNKCLWITIV